LYYITRTYFESGEEQKSGNTHNSDWYVHIHSGMSNYQDCHYKEVTWMLKTDVRSFGRNWGAAAGGRSVGLHIKLLFQKHVLQGTCYVLAELPHAVHSCSQPDVVTA